MRKLKDPLFVAALSGLCGDAAKLGFELIARKAKWMSVDGPEKAAAMVIAPYEVRSRMGQVVGHIGDLIIAGMGGLAIVYGLKLTGNRAPAAKGALIGQGIWTLMYGALTSIGATQIRAVSPKNALTEAIAHTIYGSVTAAAASVMADPSVFQTAVQVKPVSATGSVQQPRPLRLKPSHAAFERIW